MFNAHNLCLLWTDKKNTCKCSIIIRELNIWLNKEQNNLVSSLIQDTCLSVSLSYRIGPKLKMTVEILFSSLYLYMFKCSHNTRSKKAQQINMQRFFLSNTRGMTVDMLHLPNTWYLQYINTKTAQNFINVSSMHLRQ